MAPRTRATASSAPTTAPLAAAPRRRVKVTPLEKEKSIAQPTQDEQKPTTRSTRSKKSTEEPTTDVKPQATKSTAAKAKGKPKKADTNVEDADTQASQDHLDDKPKRATRATRATATTASSTAKAKTKTATRTTRTKTIAKEEPQPQSQVESEKVIEDTVQVKPAAKKKVTFQDIIEDDKENHPITTRGTKKTTVTKSSKITEKSTGLRAKPVRKPTTSASTTKTRASKRTKAPESDDEDTKPRKIQRILTPKKITQVAKGAAPDSDSEDELNGGKTPVRDLSLSPRRPQTTVTAEALARTLSPAKRLDFTQPLLVQSVQITQNDDKALMSPARRPQGSPAKLFVHSTITSPAKGVHSVRSGLESPARRPIDSPAKILFPRATKADQHVALSQSTSNLFQSPKRSAILDPTRLFARSSIKPQKTALSKSNFFSSPAKRAGAFSPIKSSNTTTEDENASQNEDLEEVLELNDMEVTELMNENMLEINVSSHQRASTSPMRTYKLSADELQMDFDDSILPVRSPLKLMRSPIKTLSEVMLPQAPDSPDLLQSDDVTDAVSSQHSTPVMSRTNDAGFVNLQSIEDYEATELLEDEPHPELVAAVDASINDEGDDTIALSEVGNTPDASPQQHHMAQSAEKKVSASPSNDIVAEFLRSPNTPASLYQHELTRMVSSPQAAKTPVSTLLEPTLHSIRTGTDTSIIEAEQVDADNSVSVSETPVASPSNSRGHRFMSMESTSMTGHLPEPDELQDGLSPSILHENELTTIGDQMCSIDTPSRSVQGYGSSPAILGEHEMTIMGSNGGNEVTPRQIKKSVASPASLYDNELTIMAEISNQDIESPADDHCEDEPSIVDTERLTPSKPALEDVVGAQSIVTETASDDVASPASIAEHELTLMAATTPQARTPANSTEKQLSAKTQPSSEKPATKETAQPTPTPAPQLVQTFTPDMPIPRKFNLHTVVSKIPLKPEGQESPFKLQLKKRKRPHSLGGQEVSADVLEDIAPLKSARTSILSSAVSQRATPTATPTHGSLARTPGSKPVSSARRVVSTPLSRVPLSPIEGSHILQGIVAYVDVRTSEGADASAIYVDLLINMGAKVVKEWKDHITHIVFKDGNPKILDKARLSTSHVHVVGVAWPLDCEAQKARVGEDEYLLNMSATDHVLQSVSRSAKRKSMEPSMLIADGSGSVKRSKSKSRASAARRSSVKPLTFADEQKRTSDAGTVATPQMDAAKYQKQVEKNSLTAAWKSINATQNLGEDTPARRTLELLQKSYDMENEWDDSIISSEMHDDEAEHDENTTLPRHFKEDGRDVESAADDDSIIDTGLTPAPYRTKAAIGSAPSKLNNVGLSSYRERVEEMERREMRDNAFGTNKGARGLGKNKAKRMTMFGFDAAV